MRTEMSLISFKKIAALVIPTYFALIATAMAGTQTGQVLDLHVRSTDGLISVELSGSSLAKPACAGYAYWLIRDENSTAGKQQLALLLAAQASGRTVQIVGTGTCVRWPDGEDIGAVAIKAN